MTREEREAAIAYIKSYRKLDEDLHNTSPKDSISYYATDKCLKYWDMAIHALSQEPCEDLLVLKSDIILHPDDKRKLTEEIKREMENGVIILQPYFEPLLVPNDIDIRIEQESEE